jgi:hypothetical protein
MNGTLSEPLTEPMASVRYPVFIPAKRMAFLGVSIAVSRIPPRETEESDVEYHERLRKFLNQELAGIDGFTLFDETNRYEIDLPSWGSQQVHRSDCSCGV